MPLMRILCCDCAREQSLTQNHGSTQHKNTTKHLGISFSELNSFAVSHKPDSNLCP